MHFLYARHIRHMPMHMQVRERELYSDVLHEVFGALVAAAAWDAPFVGAALAVGRADVRAGGGVGGRARLTRMCRRPRPPLMRRRACLPP